MKEQKYINESQKFVMETLKQAGVKIVNPIMLTANQYQDHWVISCNYMGVGINIPRNSIKEDEILELPHDQLPRIILNKVWTQKD
jgi:hypothetical protein